MGNVILANAYRVEYPKHYNNIINRGLHVLFLNANKHIFLFTYAFELSNQTVISLVKSLLPKSLKLLNRQSKRVIVPKYLFYSYNIQ